MCGPAGDEALTCEFPDRGAGEELGEYENLDVVDCDAEVVEVSHGTGHADGVGAVFGFIFLEWSVSSVHLPINMYFYTSILVEQLV